MLFLRHILLTCWLLMCSFVGVSQGLVSDAVEWDFGTIAESGGSVSHSFVLRNEGSEAVVIRAVRTSCGCTTSEYTRRPIVAGGESDLVVTYDPRLRPGHFTKDLYIYSTASSEPLTLRIRGDVTPRERRIEDRYPYALGDDSVRISMLYASVVPLERGALVQSSVEYINARSQPIEIEFRARHASDEFSTYYSEGVAAGERSQIELGYFVEQDSDIDVIRRDTLDIFVNGVFTGETLCVRGSREE